MSEENWKTFSELGGKTIKSVSGLEGGSTFLCITFESGDRLKMYHQQECCEDVHIEGCQDVSPNELEGCVVASLEEYTRSGEGLGWGICQYTFYKLVTSKVDCTIRWIGESNGYYGVGVRVDLEVMGGKDKTLSCGY